MGMFNIHLKRVVRNTFDSNVYIYLLGTSLRQVIWRDFPSVDSIYKFRLGSATSCSCQSDPPFTRVLALRASAQAEVAPNRASETITEKVWVNIPMDGIRHSSHIFIFESQFQRCIISQNPKQDSFFDKAGTQF